MNGSSSRFCINSNEGLALNHKHVYPPQTAKDRRPYSVFGTDRIPVVNAPYTGAPPPEPIPQSTKSAYDYELYLRYIEFKKKNREMNESIAKNTY